MYLEVGSDVQAGRPENLQTVAANKGKINKSTNYNLAVSLVAASALRSLISRFFISTDHMHEHTYGLQLETSW